MRKVLGTGGGAGGATTVFVYDAFGKPGAGYAHAEP